MQALTIALAAISLSVNVPLVVTVVFGVAWVAFAVLLVDRDLLEARTRTQMLSLLGLFVFSLLLHWALASGGPGDLRLNLGSIWSSAHEIRRGQASGIDLHWGHAPIALFRLVGLVAGGVRDTHIFWGNLILSSLIPILLYAIVAKLGVDPIAALLAAIVAASHPLLLYLSGVLERQPTYLFAAAGSVLALIGYLQRGTWQRLTVFILGTVLATTSRPEGAHVILLHLAIVLLVPASRRARRVAGGALAIVTALFIVYARYALDRQGGKAFVGLFPLSSTILFSPDFTPLAWIVACTVGLVLSARQRAAWVAAAAVIGLDLAWRWSGLYNLFVGHERQVASARYQTILLIPFAIALALAIQAALKMSTRWKLGLAAAFVAFTALTFGPPYETLLSGFTIDYEYRFLRKHALALQPDSRLYVMDAPIDDIGLIDANLVGTFVGSPGRFANWSQRQCDDLVRDGSPSYLYIGSSCAELRPAQKGPPLAEAYARWMQDCRSISDRLSNDAVEEVDVPARKMSWHDFKDDTLRVGLYRLTDASICALGPRCLYPPEPGKLCELVR